MNKIMHRLNQVGKSTDYTSVDELCSDFAQMFENACTYNEPDSLIYKDALTLQRTLFNKRDEIYKQEAENSKLENGQNYIEKLPSNFIENSVQEIIKKLFENCMSHRDSEGRIYSDTFLQLYSMIETDAESQHTDLVTLEYMRKRVNARIYKRMDMFQEEMFLFFNQIRMLSYIDGDYKLKKESTCDTTASQNPSKKIHRYSQLYRDTYELQRFFIIKRDELCNNGELLQSPAGNYKVTGLDSHLAMTIGGTTFDEAEALLVDKRFKSLEVKLSGESDLKEKNFATNLTVGNFYYMNKRMVIPNLEIKPNEKLENLNIDDEPLIVCVLASNASKCKFIVQLYLQTNQITQFASENSIELIKMRKFFTQEVFKSDLYALIDIENPYASFNESNTDKSASNILFKQCFVVGLKEYLNNNIKIVNESNARIMSTLENDLYICESMYSSAHNYFRKLNYKKWQPLKFLSINEEDSEEGDSNQLKLQFIRKVEPETKGEPIEENSSTQMERRFLDDSHVHALIDKIEKKFGKLYFNRFI
jgi:protein polybromo-1